MTLAQSVLFRLAGPAGKIATAVHGRGMPSRNEAAPSREAKEFFGVPIYAVFPSSQGPSPALSSAPRLLSISATPLR